MDAHPRKDADSRGTRLGSATHAFTAAEHRLCTEELNNNYTDKTNFYRSSQVMAKEHINPKPLR